jgi:hypothetical protein
LLTQRATSRLRRHARETRPVPVGPYADEVINLFSLAIRHRLMADAPRTSLFAYPAAASDIR